VYIAYNRRESVQRKEKGGTKKRGVLEYIKSDVIPPKTVKRKVAKKLRGEGVKWGERGGREEHPFFWGRVTLTGKKRGRKL
jgi:hypothetical protein